MSNHDNNALPLLSNKLSSRVRRHLVSKGWSDDSARETGNQAVELNDGIDRMPSAPVYLSILMEVARVD